MRKALLGLALAAALNLMTTGLNFVTTGAALGAVPRDPAAGPAACLPSLLPLPPATQTRTLSRGVTLRVHEVRQPQAPSTSPDRAYISIVHVERGAALVAPVTAGVPMLLHPSEPMRRHNTIAVVNGDYFEPLRRGDAVPIGALVTSGIPRFMPEGYTDVVAISSDGRMRKTKVRATGRASTPQGQVSIEAINDPLTGRESTVAYTPDWKRSVPSGRSAIVVKDGQITKVTSTDQPIRVPSDGSVIVLGESVPAEAFPRSSSITVELGVSASDGEDVAFASGHGGAFLVAGKVVPACSAYENSLRPRSMLAWNETGDVWIMTASTRQPDPPGGVRIGGATKSQLAQIARNLGAAWAVTLDGGGSTSLYARVDGKARRIDLPSDAWARPVPVLWAVRATRRAPGAALMPRLVR